MCGINGRITLDRRPDVEETLAAMNKLIIHRGPDSSGSFVFDDRVGMAMQRLSIIDTTTGDQPIFNSQRSKVIVFNGEIYNYRELKKELIADGVAFRTSSDTEVLVFLYEKYGVSMLEKLNGAFAFSIYDKQKDELFIARDRLGKKPLYYSLEKGDFLWASEMKSILKVRSGKLTIDQEALNLYFALTYIPAPFTIYKQISKLKAGEYLLLNCNNLNLEIRSYWNIEPAKIDADRYQMPNWDSARNKVWTLVEDAVKMRMIADVRVGSFLSGGVDSSIISALMARNSSTSIDTYSVGFNDTRFDESSRSRAVARHINSNHHEFFLNYQDVFESIDDIILNFDEPFADASAIPSYFVSKMTSGSVKVVLTGDGGDEVFGGYNRYLMPYYSSLLKKSVPSGVLRSALTNLFNNVNFGISSNKSLLHRIRRVVNSLSDTDDEMIISLMIMGFGQERRAILLDKSFKDTPERMLTGQLEELKGFSYLGKATALDKRFTLEGDMLVKVDRTSMLNSIECRSPLLDHRVVEYVHYLPDNFLVDGKTTKKVLKETFKSLIPSSIMALPKSGFEAPVGDWLRNELQAELLRMTSRSLLENDGILNWLVIEKIIREHNSRKANHSYLLWTVYCFLKWYEKNRSDISPD